MFRRSRSVRWVIGTIYAIGIVMMVGCAGGPTHPSPIAGAEPQAPTVAEVAKPAAGKPKVGALSSAPQNQPTAPAPQVEAVAPQATDQPTDDPFFDPFAKNDELEAGEEYDPWESVNTKVFEFNRQMDRWVLKPVAQGYDAVVPNPIQIGISNFFNNLRFPPRFINNLAQGKMTGAGTELGRFLLNSTFGFAGFVDVATELNITTPEEDTGQTLGYYGVNPGPYLVVPFLQPFTVRDFFGYLGDTALNPINWLVFPIIEVDGIPSLIAHHNRGTSSIAQISMRVGEIVNTRSLNLEKFEGVEEATLDLYTAVKNAYLQKRRNQIRE